MQKKLIFPYIFWSLTRNWLTPFLQLWPLHIHRRFWPTIGASCFARVISNTMAKDLIYHDGWMLSINIWRNRFYETRKNKTHHWPAVYLATRSQRLYQVAGRWTQPRQIGRGNRHWVGTRRAGIVIMRRGLSNFYSVGSPNLPPLWYGLLPLLVLWGSSWKEWTTGMTCRICAFLLSLLSTHSHNCG